MQEVRDTDPRAPRSQRYLRRMEEELEPESDSWNRDPWQQAATGKRGAVAKASKLSADRSQVLPSQLPPAPELFEPSQRKKFLEHLVQVQFPAIRDLAAKLLESGCFLFDASDLTMAIIERLVVEADEYNDRQPYWDWVRAQGAAVLHECVMGLEDGEEEAAPSAEALTPKMVVGDRKLRGAFNRLPLERRRALYAVAVLGQTAEDAASRLSLEAADVLRLAREGLKQVYGELKDEIQKIRDERALCHEERGTTDGQ